MSRLTKSYVAVNGNTYYEKVENPIISYLDVSTKLGKLEDLEEELGNNFSGKNEDCSFKVLFEATKNGFWYQVTKKSLFI